MIFKVQIKYYRNRNRFCHSMAKSKWIANKQRNENKIRKYVVPQFTKLLRKGKKKGIEKKIILFYKIRV